MINNIPLLIKNIDFNLINIRKNYRKIIELIIFKL